MWQNRHDYGKRITLGENILKHTIKVCFIKYCKIKNKQKKLLLFMRSENTGSWGASSLKPCCEVRWETTRSQRDEDPHTAGAGTVSKQESQGRPDLGHSGKQVLGKRGPDPALFFIQ